MRHRLALRLIGLWVGSVAATGCVEGFRGSNMEIDMSPSTPFQVSAGVTPGTGELPNNIRFTLYGIQRYGGNEALFALKSFEIHKVVDVASPCFIDKDPRHRFPGIHASHYAERLAMETGISDYRNPPPGASEEDKIDAATAAQREENIQLLGGDTGIKALVSASATKYPALAPGCGGSGDLIPPPSCIDDASNAKRLELCQRTWDSDPDLWEGTDRSLTAPLSGTTYGMVLGMSPLNFAPIGGAGWYVEQAVSSMDAYAIYYRADDAPDPGTLFLYGTPSKPTRGVTKVRMTTISNPNITADLAIYEDLGEDDVDF